MTIGRTRERKAERDGDRIRKKRKLPKREKEKEKEREKKRRKKRKEKKEKKRKEKKEQKKGPTPTACTSSLRQVQATGPQEHRPLHCKSGTRPATEPRAEGKMPSPKRETSDEQHQDRRSR